MTKETEKAAAAAPEVKRRVVVWPNGPRPAVQSRTEWIMQAPEGVTIDDLRDPKVFGRHGEKFRRWDLLEIHFADGTAYARGIIERANPSEVHVRWKGPGLGVGEMTPEVGHNDSDPDFPITYRGEIDRYCIIRKKDDVVLARGLQTMSAALLERANIASRRAA